MLFCGKKQTIHAIESTTILIIWGEASDFDNQYLHWFLAIAHIGLYLYKARLW